MEVQVRKLEGKMQILADEYVTEMVEMVDQSKNSAVRVVL